MKDFVKGTFRQSIFRSDKGYIIGLLKVSETNIIEMQEFVNKTITFTGYFAELNENEKYIMYGEIANHPKYGFQFNVKESERIKPDDKDGIVEFLSSDLFKGIGEKMAIRIVDTLGENALDLILKDKTCLYQVPKLSEAKINIIHDTLVKYEESHETIVKLTELGFTMKDSLSIYNIYKSNTIRIIENDIYRIIDDIEDINFTKVDEIAISLNEDKFNLNRIKACIVYIIKELSFKKGDTYLSYGEIYEGVSFYLKNDIDSTLFDEAISELDGELKIKIEDDRYYLFEDYDAEEYIASKINYLINKDVTNYKNIDLRIKELEDKYEIEYSDKQKEAIIKALENNILIITGGPGTGKTTIIKAIVELYKKLNKLNDKDLINNIALLAPTGRASKRMSESTSLPASTIHRFLKWNKELDEFMVNEYNPDFSNLIIVDEVSMIDNRLMNSLLRGLTNNIKLVLVGDYNQLPSVGAGNVLKDLIDSDIVDTVELDLLYRQDEYSYIPVLANEIKNETLEEDFLIDRDDYKFLECHSDVIIPSLVNIVKKVISKGYDYKRVQLMAPMYAGVNGIDNINKVLQDVFNPIELNKKEIKYGDIIYRENDKVLQLVNDPDNNVFNGDIGIIKKIEYKGKSGKPEITIDYDGTFVTYTLKDFNKFKHGFIISIHKSQGSEFELVIIPVSSSYKRMLYKKLIYTAVTRAKKRLIIIGEPMAFMYGIRNNNEIIRKTGLLEKLLNSLNKK
ncbi:MAG: ATP-dependent RecD-like DNA helicase [Bacilli bacterium]|nr:ATP-dependent RecD-like DNA helicase [Bacilli bacterium]